LRLFLYVANLFCKGSKLYKWYGYIKSSRKYGKTAKKGLKLDV
jgi:hypothetical protein